jgi:hypothetical protein
VTGILRLRSIAFAALAGAILCAAPARADIRAELETAQNEYVAAREAERQASERNDQAERAVAAAVARVTADAEAELRAFEAANNRRKTAEGELLRLLERRAEIELEVASARDAASEATRAYDQARPIYLLIGRTQSLSDYPEWKAIERRASDSLRAFEQARTAAQPRLQAVDTEIEAKRRQILDIAAENTGPIKGPGEQSMRAWIEAGVRVGQTRRELAQAQRLLTLAFDRYFAKVGVARPPFLESVRAEVGVHTPYTGIWRRKEESDQAEAARIAELRTAREELVSSILPREREAEEMRQVRIEIAESMHAMTLRYVAAEERRYDAQFNKIAAAAVAEIAGTIVEVAFTGGVATAVRKATELTEQKVAEAAAQKLLRQSAPLTDEAAEAAARLARRSEEAFARQVRSAYAEAERLAVEAAARRVQRTGEALDVATIDAKRQLQRALRGLADSDPALRAEAQRQARQLLGEQAAIILEPILRAAAGKPGGSALADLFHGGGPGGDPVLRLGADNASQASNTIAGDVKAVVMGDVYEQGIARGLSYAISVAPDAGRAGVAAMREAATANASRWRQIASGSREFIKGGVSLDKFKDAIKGTTRGNMAALATTGAKALATAYFAAEEQAAAQLAYSLYAQLTADQKILNRLREAGDELARDLNEARRLQAEIDAYLALLGNPRQLEVREDFTAFDRLDPNADIVLVLRFSAPIDKPPTATLAGVALDLRPEGGASEGSSLWRARVPRQALPANVVAAALEVSLSQGTKPFATLDSDPATPARPDPRATPAATAGDIKWLQLESGPDRHHVINLGDPWSGIWARGETRIRFDRSGFLLTGTLVSVSESSKSKRGFAAGQQVMRGDIGTDRSARLEWLARYETEWSGRCPAHSEGYWSSGRYTLDGPGALSGEWEDRQLDGDCKVAEAIKQRDALRREAAR